MRATRRPGHATVVAYLALVVALGTGGAWAAGEIGSKDIARNAVRAKHIKRGHVRTKHLRAGAVTAAKLAQGGTLYGRADASLDRAPLVKWPAMGLRVRTGNKGVPDAAFEVRIVNTNPPAGASLQVTVGNSTTLVGPGTSSAFGSLSGLEARIVENGGAGRMVLLHCFANVIAMGDDGFVQCMAITAGRR